jgi:ABC-type branched-subunit amino acid transport system permease subunit
MSEETKMFWMGIIAGVLVTGLAALGFGYLMTRTSENAAKAAFSQAVRELADAQRNSLLPTQGTKFVIAYKDKDGIKVIPKMYDTVETGLKEVPADAQGEIRVMTLKLEK